MEQAAWYAEVNEHAKIEDYDTIFDDPGMHDGYVIQEDEMEPGNDEDKIEHQQVEGDQQVEREVEDNNSAQIVSEVAKDLGYIQKNEMEPEGDQEKMEGDVAGVAGNILNEHVARNGEPR